MSAKRYYMRHRDAILLSKAYARYLKGIKPQKRTLIELQDAGFRIEREHLAKFGSGFSDDASFRDSLHGVLTAMEASWLYP
jgi:hypothetical protein